jgi:putative hemolysin
MPAAQITDPEWNDTAARLSLRTGASALPVYFCGHNSVGFQILGMLHPKLRTAFLLQEFLQQEGKRVEVRVGSVVPAEALNALPDDREAIEYLRWRTYLLGRRKKPQTTFPGAIRSKFVSKLQQTVAPPEPVGALAEEIADLPATNLLVDSTDFAVYVAEASQTPRLLLEVGRLRELTFRGVGEGTGKSRDLDNFDDYYSHILLWNKSKREIVGAYRAGHTQQILRERGLDGLYTNTLFRYDPRLFERLGPTLELGRSFVRPEYQRQYAPLLLLWKGIARFVAARPETPVLFGAVSVSNDYCEASREMIYRYFESRMQNDQLAALIQPRQPFRAGLLRPWDCRGMIHAFRDLEELSQPITDIEPDGKGLPILLRQYAKVGGKLLAFNVDRKFSNVLDGLVLVDLRQTEKAVLDKYMGHEAAVKFRSFHRLAYSRGETSALISPVAAE